MSKRNSNKKSKKRNIPAMKFKLIDSYHWAPMSKEGWRIFNEILHGIIVKSKFK